MLNDVWLFDSTSNDWQQLHTSAAMPLWGATAVCTNTTFLVFGGYTQMIDESSQNSASNATWSLDLATLEWTQLRTTNDPSPRGLSTSALVNDLMYITSGSDYAAVDVNTGDDVGVILSDTWALNVTSLEWTCVSATFVATISPPVLFSTADPTILIAFYTVHTAITTVATFNTVTSTWSFEPVEPLNQAPWGQIGSSIIDCGPFYLLINSKGMQCK